MKLLKHILHLFLFVTMTNICHCLKVKKAYIKRNEELCRKLTKLRNFQENFLLGKPWRSYYTWMVNLEFRCPEVTFKKASKSDIRHYIGTMGNYLNEVDLTKATLLGIVDKHHQEILMIPVPKQPGRYWAVPNIVKGMDDEYMKDAMLRSGIPILRFSFKLYQVGRFLLRWDCVGGIGHLMARANSVNRTEVLSMVQALNLGTGHETCLEKKEKTKTFKNVTLHEINPQ